MLLRVLIVSLLAAGAGGCASFSVVGNHPYPAYGNPVNPTPAPGYRVVCRTLPSLEVLHFTSAYGAGCTQYIVPAEVAVRTRG